MNKILVVTDDVQTRDSAWRLLTLDGYRVEVVRTGTDALRASAAGGHECVLVDLFLADMSGLSVWRALRAQRNDLACVLMTTRDGMTSGGPQGECGAARPRHNARLLDVVRSVVSETRATERLAMPDKLEAHSVARWAELVVRGVTLAADPRTLAEWGHAIGVSQGTIRNWCHTAGIPARGSLWFTRILRAVVVRQQTSMAAEDLLNIVDKRTLDKVMKLSGASRGHLPTTVAEFYAGQRFIENQSAVNHVRAVLRDALPGASAKVPAPLPWSSR